MGWPDANQPLKNFPTQRRLPISYILKFFAIACTVDVRKAAEKAINIILAQQLANRSHISQQLRTSLKSTKKRHSDTFWRLLSCLDNRRAVKGKPSHQIGVWQTDPRVWSVARQDSAFAPLHHWWPTESLCQCMKAPLNTTPLPGEVQGNDRGLDERSAIRQSEG